jgi:hypothetical protein
MITIQELHAYHKMAVAGLVPDIPCPINEMDGTMIPWVDDKDEPCMWCLSCDAKSYLGLTQIEQIKSLLHQ